MISPELMEYHYTCRDCGRDVVCGVEDAGASSHLCTTCRGELEMLADLLRQQDRNEITRDLTRYHQEHP